MTPSSEVGLLILSGSGASRVDIRQMVDALDGALKDEDMVAVREHNRSAQAEFDNCSRRGGP